MLPGFHEARTEGPPAGPLPLAPRPLRLSREPPGPTGPEWAPAPPRDCSTSAPSKLRRMACTQRQQPHFYSIVKHYAASHRAVTMLSGDKLHSVFSCRHGRKGKLLQDTIG